MVSVTLIPDRYTKSNFDPRRYRGLVQNGTAPCLVEVSDDGVVLDLNGSVLDGENSPTAGILLHDCNGVVIKNGMVKGFYQGIRAVNVARLKIENCVVSDNHNPAEVGWLPDSNEPVEEGFGGGIYLLRVSDSAVEGNRLNNNFNGISLVRSDRNRVTGNNASYCGNVGIHLLESSHNAVEDNWADHCIRYTDRFWCDTADSAGILLEERSNHNRIVGNSLRYSGDGFFIRANNRHGCNHNYVARNDASFSPNNAFEAVFSQHNVFEENVANFSNYGFWLGYSTDTTVRANWIRSNRLDGIAIECGQRNQIEGNKIEGNRNGIRLWGGDSPERRDRGETAAAGYKVVANEIKGSRERGILITEDHQAFLEGNIVENNRRDLERSP